MSVCVSGTALASTTSPLKAKVLVKYQQKALNIGNKSNVGIEIKILGMKVMTVKAYHEIFTQLYGRKMKPVGY